MLKRVLIMVECETPVRERLQAQFGDRCEFIHAGNDPELFEKHCRPRKSLSANRTRSSWPRLSMTLS